MEISSADRNLLFAVLALQTDSLDRDRLVAGIAAWAAEKSRPLGAVLSERGLLNREQRERIDALVGEQLAPENADPASSLTGLGLLETLRGALDRAGDSQLQATLNRWEERLPKSPAPPPTTSDTNQPPRFRIVRPLAAGGLGEVFVARDIELSRDVALKQMHEKHAGNADLRTRFLQEAEITSGLEHPGVVPVYGLGTDLQGRPYYAMRMIRGESLQDALQSFHELTQSRSEWLLGLRGLLRRLVDVCNAVEYAHSRGVVHRDLKPANIMLGKYGETLVVDWGLAKPIGRSQKRVDITELTLRPVTGGDSTPTQMGNAIGTPAYMSPEQAAGRHDRLTAASDVYSLGATLYHVLTGRPSQQDGLVLNVLENVEHGRFPRPREIESRVPRPLEAVCLKAMALSPLDRYSSAAELAADIENWLADEPPVAHQETWPERFGRFVRRHRTLAATGAVATVSIALLFVAIAVTSSMQAVRIAAARDQAKRNAENERRARERADLALKNAEQQRALAETNLTRAQQAEKEAQLAETEALQVADFMVGLFEGSDPLAFAGYRFGAPDSGTEVTAREMLDRGARQIAVELKDQPLIQATMMNTIGNVYSCLGQLQIGIPYLEQALEIRREHLEAGDPELADSLHNLGLLRFVQGRYDEAEQMLREAIGIRSAELGADASPTALSKFMLAWVLLETEFTDEVEQLLRDVVAVRSASEGGDPRDEAYAYAGMGLVLAHKGDNWNALLNVRKALTILQQNNDQAVNVFATAIEGIVLAQLGNSSEAVQKFQVALDKAPEVVGEIHPVINHLQISLATYLVDEDRLDAAEAVYRDALERGMKTFGRQPRLAETMNELAGLLRNQHRIAAAEELYRDALQIDREILGDDHPYVAHILNGLGALLHYRGEYAEAELCHREALGILSKRLGEDNPQQAFGLHGLAALRRLEGDQDGAKQLYAQAEGMLRECIEERDFQSRVRTAFGNIVSLGSLLRERKEYESAEVSFRQSLKFFEAVLPANDWRLARIRSELGECLTAQRRFDEAEPLLLAGYQNIGAKFPGTHQRTIDALKRIIRLYESWEKPDKAKEFRNKLPPEPPVKAPRPDR